MPMSANDVAPLAAVPASAENSGAPQASRRTDAVGAEIAVTIHASRYSATSRGIASKNLPSIHEETRTVIIFSNGAVVRLSASVTTGELVVLTNQRTGDDVICRVANVKAQPGTQNHVNLEFTQRAPSFWGDAMPADNGAHTSPSVLPQVFSPTVAFSPAIAQAPAPEKIGGVSDAVVNAPAARSPVLVPAAELISAVQAVTNLLSVVPKSAARQAPGAKSALALTQEALATSEAPAKAPAKESVFALSNAESVPMPTQTIPQTGEVQTQPAPAQAPAPAQGVRRRESTLASTLNLNSMINADSGEVTTSDSTTRAKLVLASGSTAALMASEWAKPAGDSVGTMGAIGTFGSDQKRPGSKNILIIAAAAVALLIVGGAGGAVLFRQNRPTAAQQMATSAGPASAIAPHPINSPENDARAVTKTVTDLDPEPAPSRPASEIPPAKAQASPSNFSRRPNIAVGRLSAPIAKVARPSVSSEPPPELAAPASNLMDTNLLAAPRSNEPVLPAAPSVATHVGGQLKQPKLISAPTASYPPTAQLQKVQGMVVIDVLVGTNGKVDSMNVVSGPRELQDAAMRSVRDWKYEPAQLNGQPIAVHTRVNVNFQLQ